MHCFVVKIRYENGGNSRNFIFICRSTPILKGPFMKTDCCEIVYDLTTGQNSTVTIV